MGMTTTKCFFFHLPRTGGTWVEHSLKSAFGNNTEKVVVDGGWELVYNGIHVSPDKIAKTNKFTFTFVRNPFDWYVSYYNFLVHDKTWDEFVKNTLGKYTEIVGLFEKVDFVGKTENLYYDLCQALDLAGENYDEGKFLSEHVNRSHKKDIDYEKNKKIIEEAEREVIKKYYA